MATNGKLKVGSFVTVTRGLLENATVKLTARIGRRKWQGRFLSKGSTHPVVVYVNESDIR